MATKKQKLEALAHKRAQTFEETRQEGLRALNQDRERRARANAKKIKEEQDRLEAQAAAKRELARLESEALYEQYMREEAAAKRERAVCAMRAMAAACG